MSNNRLIQKYELTLLPSYTQVPNYYVPGPLGFGLGPSRLNMGLGWFARSDGIVPGDAHGWMEGSRDLRFRDLRFRV